MYVPLKRLLTVCIVMYRDRYQGDEKATRNVLTFRQGVDWLKFDESKLLLLLLLLSLLLTANGFIW